ncbi:amino acid permease-domain-containing protein [Lactarius hatsudake]|nr:amino acid permease-domain-containing protein [Lactarius hatsudake]
MESGDKARRSHIQIRGPTREYGSQACRHCDGTSIQSVFHDNFAGATWSIWGEKSFAFGGTESLGITAGETRNPGKNIPRVVKFVFWRIMLFYLLSILLISLNVPWDYPNLSNKTATTSPFTIVFKQFGSTTAASFMNTVVLSSVISAGKHGLFAGTRMLYGLAAASHVPSLFAWMTRGDVLLPALLLTSSFSALCFGSSFIGNGQLWAWLQTLLGVSSQLCWYARSRSSRQRQSSFDWTCLMSHGGSRHCPTSRIQARAAITKKMDIWYLFTITLPTP